MVIQKILSDLNKHKFITYGRGAPSPVFNPDWALKLGAKDNQKRKPVMKVNSVYGLLLAVQSGVGLAALPDYITNNQPNLVKVLPESRGTINGNAFRISRFYEKCCKSNSF
jgi:DNA-binding transcriptional LysR family regulator